MSDLSTFYSLLLGLSKNLPTEGNISQELGREYNDYVTGLAECLKKDLSFYKIPENLFSKKSFVEEIPNYVTGELHRKTHTTNVFIDGILFRTKVAALLTNFYFKQNDTKIGFRTD